MAYGYATQLCVVDKETGRVKLLVGAHDVGKAVNPRSCEGQIEGGMKVPYTDAAAFRCWLSTRQ